jgi:phytoene dehydrogenase-like protein
VIADAVVIGAGPNGLVAANLLADAGWDVVVCEERAEPGGAVRSGEVTAPGFVHDLYSGFYPLAAGSPYIAQLDLEAHGLRWRRAPVALAHPAADGRCALIAADPAETTASLAEFAPGDGAAWEELMALWRQAEPALLEALFSPLPGPGPAARLALALGPVDLARFARLALAPAGRAAGRFRGEGAATLLAGSALHADLTLGSLGGGIVGLLLCGLGETRGFPFVAGGSGGLTDALVRRLRSRGGEVVCGAAIERIEVAGGRAVAALAADGRRFAARRAIVADCGAPALYRRMLPPAAVPARVRLGLRGFRYDDAAFKVNWALRAPIPWRSAAARRAGTVHVGDGMAGLDRAAREVAAGILPARPFLILGQYAAADPTRAPAGGEAAWAYSRVPRRAQGDAAGEIGAGRAGGPAGWPGGGRSGGTGERRGSGRSGAAGERPAARGPLAWDAEACERFAARIEAEVERLAPGFRDLVVTRHVQSPGDLEAADRNLAEGAINGGTGRLRGQLFLRPVPGSGSPRTPVAGLYLGSASAHPGGGVHGGPGGNAAVTALRLER